MTRPPQDTVRFQAVASAHRCGRTGLGGVVLQGANGGNGVIVWLRAHDSLTNGPWSLLQRGDSVTPRGAVTGVRFMIGDVAHGVPLDSGAVSLSRTGSALTATVRASGLEVVGAGRVSVDARFESVPLAPDTVPCQAKP